MYKNKYLKYKNKYLALKYSLFGGYDDEENNDDNDGYNVDNGSKNNDHNDDTLIEEGEIEEADDPKDELQMLPHVLVNNLNDSSSSE